jgi:heptaprenylglyceryl phosphate synthase
MDEDEVMDKLTEVIILACKNSAAFLKITPDPINEEMIVKVRDAFDLYFLPTIKNLDDSPLIAEAVATNLNDVLNNPLYLDSVRMQWYKITY